MVPLTELLPFRVSVAPLGTVMPVPLSVELSRTRFAPLFRLMLTPLASLI